MAVESTAQQSSPPPPPLPAPGVTELPPELTGQNYTDTLLSRPFGFVSLIGVLFGAFIMKPWGIGESLCMLQRTTGLPCPGCGLTRSVSSLLHGKFLWSFFYHPLGPLIGLLMVFLGVQALLPNRWRAPLLAWGRGNGRKVFVGLLGLLVLLLAYGAVRIVLIKMGHPWFQWWETEALPPWVPTPPTESSAP